MEINNEVIEIPTTGDRFFDEYLKLKKPLLELILTKINKRNIVLHPKLLQLFSILLYYNNKYRDMDEEDRRKLIFNSRTKAEIAGSMKINARQLNTYLSILRNIRLLNGRVINKPFIIYPEETYRLTFKFILNNG